MTTKNRSKPPSKYKVKPPKTFKDTLNLNLNHIVWELDAAKTKNCGKIPYGAITSMVRKMKPTLPWLTKDMIQHRLRRKAKGKEGSMTGLVDLHDVYLANSGQQQNSPGSSTSDGTDGAPSATQTCDSTNNNTEDNILQPPCTPHNQSPHCSTIAQQCLHLHDNSDNDNHEEEEGTSEFMVVAAAEENMTTVENNERLPTCRDLAGKVKVVEPSLTNEEHEHDTTRSVPTTSKQAAFGRPRGTTTLFSRDLKERIRHATKEAATKYADVRAQAKLANKRAERGKLTKIVEDTKRKYGIIDAKISIHTVQTRAKRNKLSPDVSQGTPSPMLAIEPYAVDLIAQLSKMRSPINIATGLQLANSLIVGTPFELKLRKWKEKHNVHSCLSKGDAGGNLLGWGYWRGFMKRNGHLIKSKKAVKFESKRADWCTHHNFSVMY